MFENIGGKIKGLAKVWCWVGIIASVIFAIIMFSCIEDASSSEEGLFVTLGLAFLILGPLVSWISSFLLYGFGELIETNCEIAKNTRHTGRSYNYSNNSSANFSVSVQSVNKEQAHAWIGKCDICGKQNVKISAAKIVDNAGTWHRNVCEECFQKYDCVSERDEKLEELLKSGLITQEEYEKKMRGE